ncbi:MAG: ABC transporter ATP-binding protein [Planctomycetes bacterium]|nr:ABC transporter ATP-binding protein [Planctomycetota bacterium]
MTTDLAVQAEGLEFVYGERRALAGVGFTVARGAAHGFLGPNGSGKSTLFRLLSTLVPLQQGRVEMLGLDLRSDAAAIRRRIGVVFQSPAVDKKLKVGENLRYAGALLGLAGTELRDRIAAVLEATRLADRERDLVDELSGGLRRRVEIAKCLLGRPEIVLLDEASTGLDPVARTEMWDVLREQEGLTVLFTTHIMDEAVGANRITLLDEGRIVAEGSPAELVREVGGQVLEIESDDVEAMRRALPPEIAAGATVVEGVLRLEGAKVHELVPALMQQQGDRIQRLQLAHPSLNDVFLHKTGKRFEVREPEAQGKKKRRRR